MDFQLDYWHWLVLGMALVLAELFVPSFTIFWFGLAAFIVAGFIWLMPVLALPWQIFLWAITSAGLTVVWLKVFKPRLGDRRELSREAVLGESGHVIQTQVEDKPGIVRFTTPLLGSDEWPFVCEQKVAAGERVFVKDIAGTTLIVESRSS